MKWIHYKMMIEIRTGKLPRFTMKTIQILEILLLNKYEQVVEMKNDHKLKASDRLRIDKYYFAKLVDVGNISS